MKKAIFLDRDGTINVEKNYLYEINEFEFISGVFEGLRLLQEKGYLLIVVTNQSGIARGYYSEGDFEVLNTWMVQEFKYQGVQIEDVFYCPHLPDARVEQYRKQCDCRKPAIGMYQKAIGKYEIDLSRSFVIGDKMRDCAICKETDCRGFLVGNNEKKEVIEQVKKGLVDRVGYATDLYEAALKIVQIYETEEVL